MFGRGRASDSGEAEAEDHRQGAFGEAELRGSRDDNAVGHGFPICGHDARLSPGEGNRFRRQSSSTLIPMRLASRESRASAVTSVDRSRPASAM
jgi:hypothetical protein